MGLLVVALALGPAPLRAQSLVGGVQPVRMNHVEGFGPDAQLVGGLGFGLDGKLDNYFLARGRLGLLYATAPWIVNLGVTAEVGALAGLGWGAELELSRGGAFFGSVGVSRVDQDRWLMHAGLGFMIFGMEWQHTFEGPSPNNALLLEVRLPLGLWWLQKRQDKADAKGASAVHTPQIKQRIGQPLPRQQSPAASNALGGEVSSAPAPAAGSGSAAGMGSQTRPAAASGADGLTPTSVGEQPQSKPGQAAAGGATRGPTDAAALDAEYATRMAEAYEARGKGDRLAEAFALSRAYALKPEPLVALQLVAAQLALGKPRSARSDWQRIGDLDQLSPADRDRAKQLQKELASALSHVRIELTGAASDLAIAIDGIVEPIATQGYDVPLDPGAHKLQLRRGERLLLERDFDTQAGALLRLRIEVPR